VEFVVAVVACSVSIGLMVITATVLGVDALRTASEPGNINSSFYLLVGGTLSGILAAAYTAWQLLAPVGSAYRRGGLSMVCAFATILLMLICIPVHQLLGRTGLLVLQGLSGVVAFILARRVRRLGAGA
jgi:predicted signal transduction protein with EAL and GGDEF domain